MAKNKLENLHSNRKNMAVYFSIILVSITFFTGLIWVINRFYLAPNRQSKLTLLQNSQDASVSEEITKKLVEPSAIVDTCVQIFPVIAFVLILRSFLYEPFQIPSGSMMPTLLDGDFILVNKYNYGLRDPIVRHKFLANGLPERGDVVVFKYPVDPNIDFIKRVVGLPGDRIIYRNKLLYIKKTCQEIESQCPDFEPVVTNFKNNDEYTISQQILTRYTSDMPNKRHDIFINNEINHPTSIYCRDAGLNLCKQAGTKQDEFVVPKGHYFVMGDNRDHSSDSRFWGFVPEENLVGEAVAIWISFDFERTESDFLPQWIPTNIRFNRIGGIH
jgi:signal peptidase I